MCIGCEGFIVCIGCITRLIPGHVMSAKKRRRICHMFGMVAPVCMCMCVGSR